MKEYFSIPKKVFASEIEINKSRFLGFATAVVSASEAEEFVDGLRNKYADARHVCFAYKLNSTAKMSDDGEPSGTAGRPLLGVLENKGLENVVLVVVRYFGGIKLGAGGLLRAYVDCGTRTLDCAPKVKWESANVCSLSLSFADYEKFKRSVINRKIAIIDTEFGDGVKLRLVVGASEALPNAKVMWLSANTLWC